MKLYNIHKNPTEFLMKDIWGLPDAVYKEYKSESCPMHRSWQMQWIRKTYQPTIDTNRISVMMNYRNFYEPKSMKIIINKNIRSGSRYNTPSFTTRIDICLHDKSRQKSNTTFTLNIRRKPEAQIAMKISSSKRSRYFWIKSNLTDEMLNIIDALPQSPRDDKSLLVFSSKPHTSAKGERKHKMLIHQKVAPEADKKIKDILFSLLDVFLYENLLDDYCNWQFSCSSTGGNYYMWPINRYPVAYLRDSYIDKDEGIELYNYSTKKPIINNYLIHKNFII
jgi:hypothetical protein